MECTKADELTVKAAKENLRTRAEATGLTSLIRQHPVESMVTAVLAGFLMGRNDRLRGELVSFILRRL